MKPFAKIIFGILFLVLTSCSEAFYIHRLEKMDSKIFKRDTITVRDTIIIPKHTIETSFLEHYSDTTKTIIVQDNRLRIQYVRVRDSIFLSGECKTDTIMTEKKVPFLSVDEIQVAKVKFLHWCKKIGLGILIALLLYVIYRILFGLLKKSVIPV